MAPRDTLDQMAAKNTKRVSAEPMQAFARNVDDYVKKYHDNNQTKAGRHLGYSQGHISQIINETKGPGLDFALKMREATGRTIDDLLGFKSDATDDLVERLRVTFETQMARAQQELLDIKDRLRAAEEELAATRAAARRSTMAPASARRRRG